MIFPVLLVLAVAPEDPPERQIAIFTAPIAAAGSLLLSIAENREPMAYVPLGMSFTAGELEWTVDVAFASLAPRGSPPVGGFTGFWFGFGPVVHSGREALQGLFFTPKLTIGGFQVSTGETMFDFLIGADFGYQLVFGRLYVVFLVGFSFGAGWAENDEVAGPGTGPEPVFGINADVMRVGFTF